MYLLTCMNWLDSIEQPGEFSAAQLAPPNAQTVPVQNSEHKNITQQFNGNLYNLLYGV